MQVENFRIDDPDGYLELLIPFAIDFCTLFCAYIRIFIMPFAMKWFEENSETIALYLQSMEEEK